MRSNVTDTMTETKREREKKERESSEPAKTKCLPKMVDVRQWPTPPYLLIRLELLQALGFRVNGEL